MPLVPRELSEKLAHWFRLPKKYVHLGHRPMHHIAAQNLNEFKLT